MLQPLAAHYRSSQSWLVEVNNLTLRGTDCQANDDWLKHGEYQSCQERLKQRSVLHHPGISRNKELLCSHCLYGRNVYHELIENDWKII